MASGELAQLLKGICNEVETLTATYKSLEVSTKETYQILGEYSSRLYNQSDVELTKYIQDKRGQTKLLRVKFTESVGNVPLIVGNIYSLAEQAEIHRSGVPKGVKEVKHAALKDIDKLVDARLS